MTGLEPFLILPAAVLHAAIMPWSIGADELMPDIQLGGSLLEKRWNIPLAVGKAFGKLKAIVGLDTFHTNASAGMPPDQAF